MPTTSFALSIIASYITTPQQCRRRRHRSPIAHTQHEHQQTCVLIEWMPWQKPPCMGFILKQSLHAVPSWMFETLVRLFSFPPVFLQGMLLQQAAFETDLSYCTSTAVVASLVILNQSATVLLHIVEAVWRLNVFLTFWITNAVHILKTWGDPKHQRKPL